MISACIVIIVLKQGLQVTVICIFQVLGNAKGAVAVVISILIFKNPVSVTGMLGYSLTVMGVVLYSEAKKRSTVKQGLGN